MYKELEKFNKNTAVSKTGQLMVNAGAYSRGAVVAAFEMLGGVTAFAEWADDNKTDFYTKMFGKIITKEVEHRTDNSVEEMLKVLDGESEDITEVEAPGPDQNGHPVRPTSLTGDKQTSSINMRLAEAAEEYFSGEKDTEVA